MTSWNTNSKITGKTLLVISPDFPNVDNRYIGGSFVKNQLEPMKKYFKKIVVIAPKLFSGRLLSVDKFCQNYCYDNVAVYYPYSLFYPRCLPPKCLNRHKVVLDSRAHAVENLIKKEDIKFDIIHAHFTWPSAYIAAKLKKTYETPAFVTVHEDSGWLSEELEGGHPRLEYAWKNIDALIRVNKKDVPRLKMYNTHTYTIPNGYGSNFKPMETQRCRRQLHLPEDKKIIFSLGALIERKGFNHLIDAMEIMTEKRKDVVCYIGGSGPQKKTLKKQIDDSNQADSIKLIGFIPDELLPVWMNACDLFVLPSLAESFGIVQIEALACGKPVVSARNNGSEEIITSDDYGLLARSADSADLMEKITIALEREWDNEKILSYAQQYSWENVAGRIIQVYRNRL